MSAADNEMLDLFVQESSEHIESLETDLIALEANPADTSRLNSIFRSVHSIKGAAGFFGFEPIVKLAHVMESVMSLLRDGLLKADESMVSLLISSSDKLRAMLANPDQAAEIPCASEAAGLQAILDGQNGPSKPTPSKVADSAGLPATASASGLPDPALEGFVFEPADLKPPLKHGQNFYVLRMGLELDIEAQGQSVEHFFNELKSLGTVIDISTALPAGVGLAECADHDVECRAFFTTALEPFILSGALGLAEDRITKIPNDTLRGWVKSSPSQESAAPANPPRNPQGPPPARTPCPLDPGPQGLPDPRVRGPAPAPRPRHRTGLRNLHHWLDRPHHPKP